jgi:hypothetical protein
MANLSAGVSMVDSIVEYVWMTLRLEYSRKVTFFDCHRRFLPLSHAFRGDKRSFLKGKTVRKGPPKRKLGADIMKMLDDIQE